MSWHRGSQRHVSGHLYQVRMAAKPPGRGWVNLGGSQLRGCEPRMEGGEGGCVTLGRLLVLSWPPCPHLEAKEQSVASSCSDQMQRPVRLLASHLYASPQPR